MAHIRFHEALSYCEVRPIRKSIDKNALEVLDEKHINSINKPGWKTTYVVNDIIVYDRGFVFERGRLILNICRPNHCSLLSHEHP